MITYVGPFPFLVTTDPEVVRDVMTSKLSIDKPSLLYDGFSNGIGEGLISLQGNHWSKNRKVFNVPFKIGSLLQFMKIFNKKANDLIEKCDNDIESGKNTHLIYFLREMSFSIAMETVIGRRFGPDEVDLKNYVERCALGMEYVGELASNFIYLNWFIRKLAKMTIYKEASNMIDFLSNFLKESLDNYKNLRGTDPSYLENTNTIMEHVDKAMQENKYDGKDAVPDLMHVFVGSFESTAATIYFTFILLAIHPEIQQQAYEEICSILPNDIDGESEVTYKDTNQMVYLDMIVNEVWRLFPVIPTIGREVTGGNLTLSNGVVLPKGQRIMIDIYNLHHSKEIWGVDADKFNPDNFLPANVENRHPFAFIPFAKGIRNCIGMRYAEMTVKVSLTKCLKRYKFSSNARMEDLVCENHVVLQMVKFPHMTIERRKKS
ncbi:probable cytochrome P450 313a4 [Stomoxys calcitrans]|uniref:probable cytochrome P450 313a4 n=1 Tax=Stomoxys calcitrans TaxID=35570 RepID=UPI0027E39B54|nr:probable cytochrome P450 313a4 [Stomoxys calcitrans]